ncbi:Transposase protein [Popillia japonica]|uniref:Transposase protein n=1 Tax=Popillia japonica TaxID=7064 RepID=A0AAW1JYF2_POPJA
MDRYCCLMFDEMALEASLSYNIKKDYIHGFENCGEIRIKKFADHAMVFMARGLRKKWKQPIAFYFSESGMRSIDLVRNIKNCIQALHQIDLHVVATICDQHTTNTAAINHLKEQTSRVYGLVGKENRTLGFVIDGQEIIPLYDAPHLLKGIRNRLMEAKAKFVWKHSEQTASWKDIVKVYETDVGDFDTKMLNKLTNQHIYKQHMKPMKVKLATQIFSQKVSSIMRGLVRLVPGFPPSASDTADFLLFFDKVFNSINGSTIKPQNGKFLRCAVTSSSDHMEFWNEAVRVLSTIKFLKEVTKADGRKVITSVPPSIKNWISTLEGFKKIWKKLSDLGFEYLCPRNLNQDPLENFFGCIRSHGVRNITTTVASFISSYKSLIVNNFASPHSPGANCEEDNSDDALDSLKNFIYKIQEDTTDIDTIEEEDDHFAFTTIYKIQEDTTDIDTIEEEDDHFAFTTANNERINKTHAYIPGNVARKILRKVGPCKQCANNERINKTHAYIPGNVARKILRKVGPCKQCRQQLISAAGQEKHALFDIRAYSAKALIRPHANFIKLFNKLNQIVHFYLPNICHESHVKAKLINIIQQNATIICNYEKQKKMFGMFLLIFIYIHGL